MFSIGDLSRRTGVKVPTIRYYESMGLIEEPERTAGNQRRYTAAGLRRLNFIRHARDLGLSIDDIRELIELGEHPDRPCHDAHVIAANHRKALKGRIRSLRKLERELARIETMCDAGTVSDCRVLEAFGDHELCEGEHRTQD